MARYKHIDTKPQLIAADLERQLLPGAIEHALNYIIDREQTGTEIAILVV